MFPSVGPALKGGRGEKELGTTAGQKIAQLDLLNLCQHLLS